MGDEEGENDHAAGPLYAPNRAPDPKMGPKPQPGPRALGANGSHATLNRPVGVRPCATRWRIRQLV